MHGNLAEQGVAVISLADACGQFGVSLLDHLVGSGVDLHRHGEAERLGGRQIDHELELVACSTGRSPGFSPLRMRPA